jgi:YbbR domain-containing protein
VQIVRKNFALKLLAVSLAIVGWAYFRFASNPIVATAQFNQQVSIPITAVDLPFGFVAHYADRQAVVTVASKRGEPAIKPEEIKAVLDLTNKETGVYNVPVQLVAPDVVVQSLSPASVTLTVEKLEEHAFPVTVHYVGTLPNGIVVSDAQTEPQAAVVRGPMSLLAQVAAVHVDVTLPSEPKSLDEMVRPAAVNAGGVEVAGLAVAPNLVRLRVRFVTGSSK